MLMLRLHANANANEAPLFASFDSSPVDWRREERRGDRKETVEDGRGLRKVKERRGKDCGEEGKKGGEER